MMHQLWLHSLLIPSHTQRFPVSSTRSAISSAPAAAGAHPLFMDEYPGGACSTQDGGMYAYCGSFFVRRPKPRATCGMSLCSGTRGSNTTLLAQVLCSSFPDSAAARTPFVAFRPLFRARLFDSGSGHRRAAVGSFSSPNTLCHQPWGRRIWVKRKA
ncbi:hypothetical protein DFH06DRAFT_1250006 [Mycena polygramma]|nr:hypothetical protein DFH06DRAFT_1250006 [Mycena polygramma]